VRVGGYASQLHYHIEVGRSISAVGSEHFPEDPLCPVALNCTSVAPGHEHAQAMVAAFVWKVHNSECRAFPSQTTPQHGHNLTAARNSRASPQSPGGACGRRRVHRSSETVSRLRPFARRRLRTWRPRFVDMRERNPCVFVRFRFDGWKVRFMVLPCLLVL
jgi:hypothetical protein